MARLPQATDLRRTQAPSQTSNVSVRQVNHSPSVAGARALRSGLGQVGKALSIAADAQSGQEDYETKKKLVDFKLQVDQAYDEYRHTMPEGAAGFSAGWQKQYGKLASGFVGKDDTNIPASQRGKVGLQLKQFESAYGRNAQREESTERDRYEIAGLETSLGSLRDRAGAKPERFHEYAKDGRELIERSRLLPDTKRKLLQKFDVETQSSHALSRLKSARSIEDFKAIQKDLSGKYEKQPWVNDLDPAEAGNPANAPTFKIHESKVPTAAQRRKIFQDGGVVVNLDTNSSKAGGQTSPMVVIPDGATPEQRKAAEAYAAKVAEVYKQQFGKSLPPRVVTRSENGRGRTATMHTEPYSVKDTAAVEFFNSEEGQAVHAKILQETLGKIPGVNFSIPHDPAKGDKGAHGSGGNEVQFARALIAKLKGGGAAPEGAGLGDEYAGPYSSLSPRERHSLWQRAQAGEKRFVEGARYETKQAMQSDLMLIRTTGEGLPGLDLEHAKTFLEPNQINRHLRQREAAQYSFRLRENMPMMKDDEMATRFQEMKPEKNEAYADNMKEYRDALKYAADIRKLRRTDPAAASDEYEGVKKAIEDARANPTGNRQEQAMTIMRERMTSQALMGIPEAARSPITEADARGLMAPLNGVKGEEIFPVLKKMVPDIVARYGEYSDEVLRFVSRTLYRDKQSQDTITAIIRNIETTGAVEAAEEERLKQLEEINTREASLSESRFSMRPKKMTRSPHPEAAEYLKAHPELAEQFDARYGKGAAAIVLEGKR